MHGGWGGGWEWTDVARASADADTTSSRPQPARTFTDAIDLTGAIDTVPRAFVRCTGGDLSSALGGDPIAPAAERARREGWVYRELAAPHDPQLTDPVGTAACLDELWTSPCARRC